MDALGETMTLDVARLPRRVWRLSGERPLAFLDATTSQDVASLEPGRGALTCVLDDKGRVLAELRALAMPDGTVLLDGEGDVSYLRRVAPLSGCEIVETDIPVTAVRGPEAAGALGDPLPSEERAHVQRDGSVIACVGWGVPGYDVIGDVSLPLGSIEDHDALRIRAGRPRYGVDVTADMLINETPYLARAVSFTKGCYPGQESVARVHNLGRVRRKVVGVHGSGLRAGALDDGIGTVTSAAGDWGIATVRAEALERAVTMDARPIEVREL